MFVTLIVVNIIYYLLLRIISVLTSFFFCTMFVIRCFYTIFITRFQNKLRKNWLRGKSKENVRCVGHPLFPTTQWQRYNKIFMYLIIFGTCTLRRHLRRVWFVFKIHMASPSKHDMSPKGTRTGRLIN